MKSVIGHVVVALLLAAAGGISWLLGAAERRVAQAHQALATMQYATVADTAGELEDSLRLVGIVPRTGSGMTAAVREDRSTAEYWLARYDALAARRDASGAVVERDPNVLLVSANAAYRALDVNLADRQTLVRSLDGIVKSYAEVLKSGAAAGNEDAAYNYEFLVRQRDQMARARGPVAPAKADLTGTTGTHPSIHGRQGAPPKGVDMSRFRIMIPKRSDERQENLEPGKGDTKGRRG
ncbi:MAG: hypothetical protein WBD07_10055 [Vicinamibacterales bacterium]